MASQPEEESSMFLRNFGVLPHHYMASQPEEESSMVLRNVGILPHRYMGKNLKMEAARSSETFVSYRITRRRSQPEGCGKMVSETLVSPEDHDMNPCFLLLIIY
jgi:hypothetical protein